MIDLIMGGIYTAISWILLRWHELWSAVLPGSAKFLGTNWDWILAIVFLVITIRILLFPIFVKQIKSQRAMQALAPKMRELQEKYKGDPQTLRQEMVKLYQEEKVNPLMGCLPMFLQIPVFFGLFHVLKRLDPEQTKNTTLYGWTQAQWDSAAAARLFDAPIASRFADGADQLTTLSASGVTVKLVAGVLVLIMMTTTFLTSRQMILKTGWAEEPQQRTVQKLMLYGIPISLLMSGWYFPIGVIIYWVTTNIFSLGQQYWVLHKYPPPALAGAKAKELVSGKNAIMRFLSGEPIRLPKPAGAAPAAKTGLFRRRQQADAVPELVVDKRSLAPRPGAKPVRVKPSQPESGANAAARASAPEAPKQGDARAGGAKSGRAGSDTRSGARSGTQGKRASTARKSTSNKRGGSKR